MPVVELHPEAEEELVEGVRYLNGETESLGDAFLDAFYASAGRLATYPYAGRLLRGKRYRRWVMRRWRHSIIYAPIESGIFVIAVAHHSRRPNYWRDRAR